FHVKPMPCRRKFGSSRTGFKRGWKSPPHPVAMKSFFSSVLSRANFPWAMAAALLLAAVRPAAGGGASKNFLRFQYALVGGETKSWRDRQYTGSESSWVSGTFPMGAPLRMFPRNDIFWAGVVMKQLPMDIEVTRQRHTSSIEYGEATRENVVVTETW